MQIESSNKQRISFINNKSRQFFDSLLHTKKNIVVDKFYYENVIKFLLRVVYLFEISSFKNRKSYFFTIIFGNVSLDILCLLSMYEQKYSFIKLKKYENKQINNDFEFNFKVNKLNLNNLNELLIIGVDTYLESTYFSLQLKQKGNYNSTNLGSIKNKNIKNKSSSLGSSINTIVSIAEGIHVICQNLKNKNSLIVMNSEFFKRKNENSFSLVLFLKTIQKFCNISVLNSSIYETGVYSVNNFSNLNKFDFTEFSSIYLINVLNPKTKFIDKLYYSSLNSMSQLKISSLKSLYIQQSDSTNIYKKNLFYLPVKHFFENEEIFYNNKGILKYTTEIQQNKELKSNWKLIRTLFNNLKKKSLFVSVNNLINFSDIRNKKNLLNSIHYIFLAVNSLKPNNFFVKKNSLFFVKNVLLKKKLKLNNTKIQYWLNDFFIGGKDSYSSNSSTMVKCSKLNRLQTTNFF